MASFGLLTVLGNGSGRIATHHRFSVAAYQSGSVLVLWDYARPRGEARKFVTLEPNQRCERLFFAKDARSLLGFWLSQAGQPTLTVWRVGDGAKVAEHRLSDTVASLPLWADFHVETSYFVFAHGGPSLLATVMYWDADSQQPHYVSHGPVGAAAGTLGVSLLDDGRHFVLGGAGAVQFWSFAEQSPRLALKVDFGKPVRAVQVWDHLVYLLTQRGSLQMMNFEGQRAQQSITPPAGAAFTAVAVCSDVLCLGSDRGELLVYDAGSLELRQHVPAPLELSQGLPAEASTHTVEFVSLGMNQDYACVCFADAAHGAVHLPSARYVALRVGHRAAVRDLAMAPRLELPPGLGGRLLDQERVLLARALAFVTVSGEAAFIAWPQRGPPARAALRRPAEWPRREDESAALECWEWLAGTHAGTSGGLEQRELAMTAAAFYPRACLSHDGRLTGAYQLLAGAEDGSVHLLESDEGSGVATAGLSWRPVRIRPPSVELCEPGARVGTAGDAPGAAACCHLAFSRCGRFATASRGGGGAELLHFPALTQALALQGSAASLGGPVQSKALFAWHPTDAQRKYDQNIYVLSHTSSHSELALYEVYVLGNSYAKSSRIVYALPAICLAAGGAITDFCVHPSQLYLLVAAALPAAETRAAALVFDLWGGELLKSCALFSSLLLTPLQPPRPSLCVDASGAFLFCTSSPTMVGSLDQNMLQPPFASCAPSSQNRPCVVSDSLMEGSRTGAAAAQLGGSSAGSEPRASAVCVIDFSTGQQIYQSSMEASCLSLGSLTCDPMQLVAGARDGTVSIWRPPEPVASRALSLLEDSKRELLAREGKERDLVEHLAAEDLEEAVALHWVNNLRQQINWELWGQGPLAQPPSFQRGFQEGPRPQHQAARQDADDVVVQARRGWPPPSAAPGGVASGQASAQPLARASGFGRSGEQSGGLEPDGFASTGADEHPLLFSGGRPSPPPAAAPPPWPSQGAAAGVRPSALTVPMPRMPSPLQLRQQYMAGLANQRLLEPAELLGPAPELREEFGTAAEHFQDPLPSAALPGDDGLLGVPRWLERGRPQLQAEGGAQEAVVQSVFSEIEHFEAANPSSKNLGDADDSD